MEGTTKEGKETTISGEKKGKRKWVSRILNFLMYGGWLLVVIVVLAIVVLVSTLTK